MIQALVDARLWLAHLHPVLPAAVLMLVIWLPQYLIRRFAPKAWEIPATWPFQLLGIDREKLVLLRKAWQALPSVALAALLQALTVQGDTWAAVSGAALGLLAPAWHELWKALPVPYMGGKAPAADPPAPPADDVTPTQR